MTVSTQESAPLSVEAKTYLEGATEEGKEFDFLIGCWDCQATNYSPDGSLVEKFDGSWEARYAVGGRMVIDTYKRLAPNGEEISTAVTLRTYCEDTERWEMVALFALRPQPMTSFIGRREGDEMHLEAKVLDSNGTAFETRVRFFRITPDSFDWELKGSLDGENWVRLTTITAKRRACEESKSVAVEDWP